MYIFNEVSRNRKILDRIIGILLILISIAIAIFLIPSLIPLIKRTPYQILEPDSYIRHKLGVDWIMQSIGWICAYYTYRGGRDFLRDSKNPS